jgi:2-oxoglutarate ferredoxin oxidoreductase subunit alpha
VVRAGHGEFPKVVVAPGDIVEAFHITRLAFEIAEKYHTQVYILGDKFLLESSQSVPRFADTWTNERFGFAPDILPEDGSFQRFALAAAEQDGVSPRSIPGQAHGLQLTNSYEHDEHGYATEESEMTKAMVDKRLRKLDAVKPLLPKPILLGPENAEITFVEWGSTKLVIEEVIRQANAVQPQSVNAIHIQTAMPFHVDEFMTLAQKAKKLVMVEGNATHQCEQLIREQTGIVMHDHINRYDGRPFFAENLIAWVDQHKGVT